MRRILATAVVAAAAGLALVARPVAAQSVPNITAAKTAATNAANATNAHTAAVTGAAAEKPAKPAKPVVPPTKGQPAKAQPAQAQPVQAQPAQAQPAAAKPDPKAAKPASAKPDAKASTPATPATPAAAAAANKPDPKAAKPDPKAAKPETKPEAKPAKGADQSRTAAPVARDSAETIKVGATTNVAKRGAASELTFSREIYSYPGRGRRDPFMSLLKSGDLRPMLSDLRLVTVLYDPTGRNSVAIMRDLSTKDQYRVKVGQQLGRMRVAQIQPKQLVLTIEEFGFNRQETLALTSDSTRTR